MMSSCVSVKEEVTSEVEEDDEEEKRRIKQRKRKERKKLYLKQRYQLIRRICAGEHVPGVGEEERRRIIGQEEKRRERALSRQKEEKRRERTLLRQREKKQLARRLLAGEDVPGIGEEEKKRIIEREERRRKRNRGYSKKAYEEREKLARERIKRICAGEDVPGVGEEERRRILEEEEKRKERRALAARERMERIRRICAGEDVPGVGEEERLRIIEKEEKQKEIKRLYMRKRHVEKQEKRREYIKEYYQRKKMEETAEEREARIARQRFNSLVRRVQRTDEEKEEIRRQNYFNMQARMAIMSEEERQEWKRRRNERHKERLKNLSEEKRKKHAEALKSASKKWQQKMKERDPEVFKKRMQEFKSKWVQRFGDLGSFKNWINNKTRKRYEGMSEEEKRRRLNQMKMYQQKRNLRRKLEGTMDDEEIERRLDELDKRLREELGIGPPRLMGRFGKKGSDSGYVNVDTSYSEEISTGPVDKQEVGHWSDNSIVNLITTTSYPDLQTEQVKQAESNFCDFDDDEGASMPSPPEATELNSQSVSPYPPQQQLDSVTSSIIPETAALTFSCEYCECPPFLTENDLKSHLKDNHLKICWKCPSCKEVMISSKHLSEHFKSVHKKPSTSSTADIQTVVHQAKKPELDAQDHNFSQDKTNSRKFGDNFGRKTEFLCLRCPSQLFNSSKIITVFKDWRGLHSHVRNKHRKYYWPCEHCHLLKYSKQSLSVHQVLCRKKSET